MCTTCLYSTPAFIGVHVCIGSASCQSTGTTLQRSRGRRFRFLGTVNGSHNMDFRCSLIPVTRPGEIYTTPYIMCSINPLGKFEGFVYDMISLFLYLSHKLVVIRNNTRIDNRNKPVKPVIITLNVWSIISSGSAFCMWHAINTLELGAQ